LRNLAALGPPGLRVHAPRAAYPMLGAATVAGGGLRRPEGPPYVKNTFRSNATAGLVTAHEQFFSPHPCLPATRVTLLIAHGPAFLSLPSAGKGRRAFLAAKCVTHPSNVIRV